MGINCHTVGRQHKTCIDVNEKMYLLHRGLELTSKLPVSQHNTEALTNNLRGIFLADLNIQWKKGALAPSLNLTLSPLYSPHDCRDLALLKNMVKHC